MHGRHVIDRCANERRNLSIPGGDTRGVGRAVSQLARHIHAGIGREHRGEAVPILRIHATEIARLELLDLLDRFEALSSVHSRARARRAPTRATAPRPISTARYAQYAPSVLGRSSTSEPSLAAAAPSQVTPTAACAVGSRLTSAHPPSAA